jgi:hypothetical protein
VPQLLLSDGRSVQVPLQQPCPLAQQVQVLKDSLVEQQANCPGGQEMHCPLGVAQHSLP